MKKGTKSKSRKSKAWDANNIKANGMNGGLVLAGLIGANVLDGTLDKVTAIKNDKIKKAIPLVLGIAALGANDKKFVSVGYGMLAFGAISLTRNVLGLSGHGGVDGISDKMKESLTKLLPNLGNADYPAVYDNDFIEDIDITPVQDVSYSEVNEFNDNPYSGEEILNGSLDADSYLGFTS